MIFDYKFKQFIYLKINLINIFLKILKFYNNNQNGLCFVGKKIINR
jgi:hypothetical protein